MPLALLLSALEVFQCFYHPCSDVNSKVCEAVDHGRMTVIPRPRTISLLK